MKELIKKILSYLSPSFKSYRCSPLIKDYPSPILSEEEGNNLIISFIKQNNPFMIGRIGTSELQIIKHYDFYRKNKKYKKRYPFKVKEAIYNNAGFFPFPENDDILDNFSEIFLNSISKSDVIGVWFNPYENIICQKYSPNAKLIPLRSIEPYYFNLPWSKYLENKKVLVIHPFIKSFQFQYLNKREKLFMNKDVLPFFELKVLKSVQSIAGEKTDFKNWFLALEYLKDKIVKIDFDIAIIGAGSYGIPLTGFIKTIGKSAIYMGGATQILFGVKGKAWENHDVISKFFNDNWINPSEEERPKGFNKVEDGCYW